MGFMNMYMKEDSFDDFQMIYGIFNYEYYEKTVIEGGHFV